MPVPTSLPLVATSAPDFTLPDQDGARHALSAYRGSWVVLYFYPKDDTPGCTTQACEFRDNFSQFEKIPARVIGISVDPVKKHQKFASKFLLPFTMLADESKEVVKQYGVWAKKKFMGREYDGIVRTTFLIDPTGRIAKIYEQVKPAGHPAEVLADLRRLTS
jgi:peroxiredoxin Q/BCP